MSQYLRGRVGIGANYGTPSAMSTDLGLRDRLAAALARHPREDLPPLPGRTNHIDAGILVPLVRGEGDLGLVITERTTSLATHPGELCFPGGRPDAGDEGLL